MANVSERVWTADSGFRVENCLLSSSCIGSSKSNILYFTLLSIVTTLLETITDPINIEPTGDRLEFVIWKTLDSSLNFSKIQDIIFPNLDSLYF